MFQDVLIKMKVENNEQVDYFLDFKNDFIHMNQLIGKKIILKFKGYECLNCQSNIEIYRQGYCKKCFFEIPSTAQWVMKPELSKAHLNIEERDLEYEKQTVLKNNIIIEDFGRLSPFFHVYETGFCDLGYELPLLPVTIPSQEPIIFVEDCENLNYYEKQVCSTS